MNDGTAEDKAGEDGEEPRNPCIGKPTGNTLCRMPPLLGLVRYTLFPDYVCGLHTMFNFISFNIPYFTWNAVGLCQS